MAIGGCTDAKAPATPPQARVGTDNPLSVSARWYSPVVVGDGHGGYLARLAAADEVSDRLRRSSLILRLGGIGFPSRGIGAGRPYVGPGPDARWTAQNGEYSVSFGYSGERLGLLVWSTGGQWRVRVNGRYLGTMPRSVGSGYALHTLRLDFSRAGASNRRLIQFDLSGGAWLAGIEVGGAADRVWLPARPPGATPSVYWLGDSYVAGSGARFPGFDDLAHVASSKAGLDNVTVDALGGTGYVKSNPPANFPNYLVRARLNLGGRRAHPQLVIVAGSINDGVYSEVSVRQAANALYARLARVLPRAMVIVVPFTPAYPVPQAVAAANAGILAAAHAAPNVVGTLDLPAVVTALRGEPAALRRSGALVSEATTYHPSPAGHQLYGQLIGAFIARCLREVRARGAHRGLCDA